MKCPSFVRRRRFRGLAATAAAATAAAALQAPALAAPVNGDVLFLQDRTQQPNPDPTKPPIPVPAAVIQVDRATGTRTVLSQSGVRGAGPDFNFTIGGIDVGPRGDIYVGAAGGSSVFRIDPVTGDRTVLSSPAVGAGPTFSSEGDLVVGPSGDLFVARDNSIYRVNPMTGDRSVVTGPGTGAGPDLVHVVGLAPTPTGDFYTLETSGPNGDGVFFVNGATGDRTLVSGGDVNRGSGPDFSEFGTDVELLRDGSLAVADHENRILRIDPATGNRSILAGPGVGTGPDLGNLEWLSLTSNGSLLASGSSVFLVDPATGSRTILAATPTFVREAVEYSAVPEPIGLSWLGIGMLTLLRRRKAGDRAGVVSG